MGHAIMGFLARKETASCERQWHEAKVTSIRLQSCTDPQTDMLQSHQGYVSVRILINLRRQSRASLRIAIMSVFCHCTSYTSGKSSLHRWHFLKSMNVV